MIIAGEKRRSRSRSVPGLAGGSTTAGMRASRFLGMIMEWEYHYRPAERGEMDDVSPNENGCYDRYPPKKKSGFLMAMVKTILWGDVLYNALQQAMKEPAFLEALSAEDPQEEDHETIDPRFVFWSLWMNQVYIALSGFDERGINIPGLGLSEKDRKILKGYRDVNKHVRSRLDDKDFTAIWEDTELPVRVKHASLMMKEWITEQTEWSNIAEQANAEGGKMQTRPRGWLLTKDGDLASISEPQLKDETIYWPLDLKEVPPGAEYPMDTADKYVRHKIEEHNVFLYLPPEASLEDVPGEIMDRILSD